jgi:hypothetical protein
VEQMSAVSFFPTKGFLGTGAPFGADLNLVVQLIMGLALIAGVLLAKQKRYTASRNLPDDSAAIEFVNDRIGDVAVVPATSKAGAVEGSS